MEDRAHRVLLLAAALAVLTAWLGRTQPVAAALLAALATLQAPRGGPWTAGYAALPVLLASLPSPPQLVPLPPPGPVRIDGTVATARRDAQLDETAVLLAVRGGRLWLHIDGPLHLLPGDRIQATARCAASAIPGERSHLRAVADAVRSHRGPPSLPRACALARDGLEDALRTLCPGELGTVLATLVLGNSVRLPGDVAAAHQATGLSHLLAVSGAHAAMLAWLLGLQPFGAGRRRPVGRAHLTVAMTLLLGYGAITGFEPPVFRALCSYGLAAAGLQLGRRLGVLPGLVWPLLLGLLVDPARALGPSHCLSYAAVVGLALAGPPRNGQRLERWLWAPIRASAWATATTAPFTLLWFGQLAPWTILLTPLLAPLVAALLFAGLGGGLLTLIVPAVATVLGPPIRGLLLAYLWAVERADALPATPVLAPTTPPASLLLALSVAGAVAFALWPGRRGARYGLLLACLPHFLPAPASPPGVQLFAVGHGQACLCTLADGTTIAVDCGSLQSEALPAHRIEQALRRRRIDVLVLTHGDRDHVSGVASLLRRLRVGRAIMPTALRDEPVHAALRRHGVPCTFVDRGTTFDAAAGCRLAAPAPAVSSRNDDSLWVRLELPGATLLATGDAEEAGVADALRMGIAAPATILVLPHHGRDNAGGGALLAAVRPQACLVSNRSGEGRSVLGELAARQGAPTFATGMLGDVHLSITREGLALEVTAGRWPLAPQHR